MSAPKNKTVKTSTVNPNQSNTVNTEATILPAPSAPLVADNATPNGAPTTSADPADLTNDADPYAMHRAAGGAFDEHGRPLPFVTERAPEAGPVAWDVRGYVHTLPGGTPVKDTGFSPLLGRAIDVYLGRAPNRARAAVAMATVRACYKAGVNVQVQPMVNDDSPLTVMCVAEHAVIVGILSKLVSDKDEGKHDRALTGVGRRIAAAEKAVTRAVKSTGMSAGAVRETGADIARAIIGVETAVDNQRAFMRSFRA